MDFTQTMDRFIFACFQSSPALTGALSPLAKSRQVGYTMRKRL